MILYLILFLSLCFNAFTIASVIWYKKEEKRLLNEQMQSLIDQCETEEELDAVHKIFKDNGLM